MLSFKHYSSLDDKLIPHMEAWFDGMGLRGVFGRPTI